MLSKFHFLFIYFKTYRNDLKKSNLRLSGLEMGFALQQSGTVFAFGPRLQRELSPMLGRGLRFDPEWRFLPGSEGLRSGAVEWVKNKRGSTKPSPFIEVFSKTMINNIQNQDPCHPGPFCNRDPSCGHDPIQIPFPNLVRIGQVALGSGHCELQA